MRFLNFEKAPGAMKVHPVLYRSRTDTRVDMLRKNSSPSVRVRWLLRTLRSGYCLAVVGDVEDLDTVWLLLETMRTWILSGCCWRR